MILYNYPLRLRLPLWITIPHRPFLTMARMDLCGNESPIGSIENIDFSLPLASPFKFITGYLGADCIEDYAQVDLIHFMSTYVNLCMSHKHRLLRRLCVGTQHHSAPVSGRSIFVQRGEHLCHWPVPVSTWMIPELVISVGSMKWKLHYIPDIPRDPRRWPRQVV